MGRLIALLSALLILGPSLAGRPGPQALTWPGCDVFTTRPESQAYWESEGWPAVADPDGDGKVCESLPGASQTSCARTDEPVTVPLSRSRYPESTLHFEVAWEQGVTHRYTIARNLAKQNRKAWHRYVPPGVDADGDGQVDDRDEVPMAFTREGSLEAPNGRSASHIAYIDASDNRGAGSFIGRKLRSYCNGTHFQIRPTGRRERRTVIVVVFHNGERVQQVVRRR